jgi:predicted acyltransferase
MAAKRLLALDVMRGMSIALMILVNTPGSWEYVYPPLLHSKWHGCTPTDLVFPFFLFIIGVSLWYSSKKFNSGLTKKSFLSICKRSSILFLLGLFLNAFPYFDIENLRILGVLQRISIAYFIGALLCIKYNPKQLILFFLGILLTYWALLFFGASEEPYGLTNNIVRFIDITILGENHIYQGFGTPFDPEGLLSAIPSVATLLLGYFAGQLIEYSIDTKKAIITLFISGILIAGIGQLWGTLLPINKALWTSSYVLYTGGLAFCTLAILLWIIDLKNVRFWTKPFIHFGTNPLFIYVFSGIYTLVMIFLVKITLNTSETKSGFGYLYSEVFVPIAGNMNGSFLFALTHIFLFWIIVFVLYKKKVFIKI